MMTTTTTSKRIRRRYLLARHGETNFNKEGRIQGTSDVSVLTLDGISQAVALGAYVARRQAGDATDDDDEDIGIVSSSDPPHFPPETATATATVRAPPITRTWCSPLTRCRQTYAAVSGCCSSRGDDGRECENNDNKSFLLPHPTISHDLREIELREWQGRLRREIEMRDGENWNAFMKDPTSLRLDDGKFAPVLDCWERGLRNWHDIRSDAASSSEFVAIDNADSADAVASKRVSSSSTSTTTTDDDSDVDDDDDAAAAAAANGAVFVVCHGAMLNCMLLRAVGMDVDAYGKSREYEFGNCDCVEVEWYDDDEISTRWRRVHPRGGGGWRYTITAISSMRRMGGMCPSSGGGGPSRPSRSEEISEAFAPGKIPNAVARMRGSGGRRLVELGSRQRQAVTNSDEDEFAQMKT